MGGGIVDGTPYGPGSRARVLEGTHQLSGIDNLTRIARVRMPFDTGEKPDERVHVQKPLKRTDVSRRSVGKGGCGRCEWLGNCFSEGAFGEGARAAGVTSRASGKA